MRLRALDHFVDKTTRDIGNLSLDQLTSTKTDASTNTETKAKTKTSTAREKYYQSLWLTADEDFIRDRFKMLQNAADDLALKTMNPADDFARMLTSLEGNIEGLVSPKSLQELKDRCVSMAKAANRLAVQLRQTAQQGLVLSPDELDELIRTLGEIARSPLYTHPILLPESY
jgi:uncharacterized protein (DUF885 family)